MKQADDSTGSVYLFLDLLSAGCEILGMLLLLAFEFIRACIALYIIVLIVEYLPVILFLSLFGGGFIGFILSVLNSLLKIR